MAGNIALILLASGLSKRFGVQNKLLADLMGQTVIERLLTNIEGLGFSHKYAVISDPAVGDIASRHGFSPVQNECPNIGQGQALRLGASRAYENGDMAACVLLADMPFIDAAYLKPLLGASEKHDVIMSEYAGVRMPPAIFSGKAFKRLERASGDQPKPFVDAENIMSFPLTKIQAMDIDTRTDLAAARKLV